MLMEISVSPEIHCVSDALHCVFSYMNCIVLQINTMFYTIQNETLNTLE